MRNYKEEAIQRFWSRVDKKGPKDCWLWKRPSNSFGGYAHMYFNGRRVMIHRISMELHLGRMLDPYNNGTSVVRHTCDTPLCVNPNHLCLGTQGENVEDMISKNRMPLGEDRGSSKLTEKKVRRIKKDYKSRPTHYPRNILWPNSIEALAVKHSVPVSTVQSIIKGTTWSHVK